MVSLPVPAELLQLPEWAFLFLTLLTRIASIISFLPALGEPTISRPVKLATAIALTAVLTPVVSDSLPPAPASALALIGLLAGETLIGAAIGIIIRLFMGALQTGGSFIALQIGLASAQIFNPAAGIQGALVGVFLGIIATAMIFVTDLHHVMIVAIRDSYVLFPPGAGFPIDELAALAVETMAQMFVIAIQFAAPFIVFGLTIYLASGVLSRLIPQVQVFFLVLPINILMGFAVMSLTIGIAMTWFIDRFRVYLADFLVGA